MSQAVRDAIAQRRAALAQAQKAAADSPLPSPTKSGFESSKDSDIVQRSEDELLYRSVSTARLNISSRLPALEALPSSLFSLLDGEAPQWYLSYQPDETRRRPWYEREDLRVLSAANNDIDVVDERIGDFRGLARLELQNNRIPSLPRSTFQLVNLTTLNLFKNRLTSVPQALLALDSLIELDVSHNAIARLWTDAEVDEARRDRKAWDEDNADEEGGIWSGLLERMGSPTKRARPLPPSGQKQRSQPMRSLRVLNLAHNRLDDAALHDSGSWTWPPALVDLDVSDNRLRSTLPLSIFGRLKDLARLSLGGSGFGDAVFAYDEARGDKPETPFGQQTFFPSLVALDLQRCEIDDLDKLKSVFELGEGVDVEPRTLLRVPSMAHAKKDDDEESSRRTLSIVLEGNPLREEVYKAKRGGASVARAATKPTDSVEATFSSMILETAKEPASSAAPTAAPSTPQSAAPAQTSPRKEAWELEAEAGLSTEGGRRRARAEAARREREAAAGGAVATPPASSSSTSTPTLRNGSRSRQADGVNKTGLSDWDGTPVASPRRANIARGEDREQQRSGTRHDEQRNGGGGGGGRVASLGSTLANAKLTKRQSEALGRVPCKFFRSATGCSAGEACPFAHTTGSTQAAEARNGGSAGAEGDKGRAVCEFFIKGNCRFGHKCALAHVREGEPMSMDRHNKKMAAAAQRAAGGATTSAGAAAGPKSGAGAGSSQHQQQPSQHLFQLHQQPQQQPYTQPSHASYKQQPPPPPPSAPPISYPAAAWPPRDDFAFGLPDDMNEGPHRPPPSQLPLPHSSGIGQTLHSSSRPLPYPQQQAAPINTASFTSSSPFAAGPPFGTSPFGSSPFGETVFYSNSYDDRRGSAVDEAAVASAAGGSFAARNARQQQQQRGVGWADGGESRHYYDEEAVDDADHDGEDFLPSSLNDLLTPAELERRRRRSAATGEMPAMAPLTQSMPAGYGVDDELGKGIWDVGGNARQRPAAGMSVGGGLGAAVYDEADDILDIEVPNGLGVTPPPARRHHLQHHLLHHSPGQSLPKGLAAAGLSRLRISSTGSGASQPVAAAPSQAHHGFTPSSLSLSQAQAASSPHRRALNNAQAITSSSPLAFASYAAATSTSRGGAAPSPSDLGPTAPSSLHPHLPGGVLAARGSNSSLSSAKLGTSASNNHNKASTAAAPGTSPLEGMAFGSILLSPPTGKEGATTMSTMMMAGGGGGKGPAAAVRSARRPSRGHPHAHVGGVAAAASPVALMPRRGEEVGGGGGGEEEGVFELE